MGHRAWNIGNNFEFRIANFEMKMWEFGLLTCGSIVCYVQAQKIKERSEKNGLRRKAHSRP